MKDQTIIEEACKEGTALCICAKLSELYDAGRLKLYHGTVSRLRLEEQLEVPRHKFGQSAKHNPNEAPGRCIRRFDKLLEDWGHGTVWTEKIPAIQEVLERHKLARTLPVNDRGNLNRTEILRQFGLSNGNVHPIVAKNREFVVTQAQAFSVARA